MALVSVESHLAKRGGNAWDDRGFGRGCRGLGPHEGYIPPLTGIACTADAILPTPSYDDLVHKYHRGPVLRSLDAKRDVILTGPKSARYARTTETIRPLTPPIARCVTTDRRRRQRARPTTLATKPRVVWTDTSHTPGQ